MKRITPLLLSLLSLPAVHAQAPAEADRCDRVRPIVVAQLQEQGVTNVAVLIVPSNAVRADDKIVTTCTNPANYLIQRPQ